MENTKDVSPHVEFSPFQFAPFEFKKVVIFVCLLARFPMSENFKILISLCTLFEFLSSASTKLSLGNQPDLQSELRFLVQVNAKETHDAHEELSSVDRFS